MHARPLFVLFFLLPIFTVFAANPDLSLSDDELLDTIQRKSFDYFMVERDPKSGLVYDRASNFEKRVKTVPASIAATGFALTAYTVGVERNWIDVGSARDMTERILNFFVKYVPHERGFFYHYLDPETGERAGRSELSPLDTALFFAGALYAAGYYQDGRIRDLAVQLYERVDWPWMLHGGETFALSWTPEERFSKGRWDQYNESMILYLLAIGSPTHSIPASSWKAVIRPAGSYKGHRLIQSPPLFTHQYSHIWIDFRNKHDEFADYFQNSVNAALAQRAFAIDQAANFQSYGPNSWGLTAGDGPFGYRAYGAPPGWAEHDGTLAPTACGSSIPFTPRESIACLRHFYETLGEKIWGTYGFSDAFNLDKEWFDSEVIAIDQGALLLMIENYRSGLIWKTMSRNNYLTHALNAVGFRPGTKEIDWPEPPVSEAPYVFGGLEIDGYLRDWPSRQPILLDVSHKESGSCDGANDLSGKIRFAWDEEALYFMAEVTDSSVVLRKNGASIWRDDLLEIFVDPSGDGLFWYGPKDYQIGFRVDPEDGSVQTWSWFQGGEDPSLKGEVAARGFVDRRGYLIEGAIRWRYLGMRPEAGNVVRISPAIHDQDKDRTSGKLQWFFRNEEEYRRFSLGKVVLKASPPSLPSEAKFH